MKKMFLIVLAVLIVFCISIYIFIPGKLNISSATIMNASENGTKRYVFDATNWPKWWNYGDTSAASYTQQPADVFTTNKDAFRLTKKFYNAAKIDIRHNQHQFETELVLIPLRRDSTGIEWKYTVKTSTNPFKRFAQYMEAREIKKNMDGVLHNLRLFLGKNDNIYGIHIERTSIKDTLFVSARSVFTTYPTTSVLYDLIKKIQVYTAKNNSKQTGNPIFNITGIDNNLFQLMAAIPIDKALPENDQFALKKMIKGSFMVTEVVGGEYSVDRASKKLLQYFDDYQNTSMAINFTMLITDRMYQPDTTKWITRLYQPVY